MRSFGIFSSRKQYPDVIKNALEMCDQARTLAEALGSVHAGLAQNLDFVRSLVSDQEEAEEQDKWAVRRVSHQYGGIDSLPEQMLEMDRQLSVLRVALEELSKDTYSNLGENYDKHEHRIMGAQRTYQYHLAAVREACPDEDRVDSLARLLSEVEDGHMELDLSFVTMMRVTLDSVGRLPDDLSYL